ncbi:hypothetical protein ACU686_14875 [Yinghuangia aomiensis]
MRAALPISGVRSTAEEDGVFITLGEPRSRHPVGPAVATPPLPTPEETPACTPTSPPTPTPPLRGTATGSC